MKNPTNTYLQNRSALFDWIVFTISVSLGFIFPNIGSFVMSPHFKWWMLAVITCYTIGAWLKHLPLSYRLTHDPALETTMPLAIFMIIGHWCIFFALIFMAQPALSSLFGITSWMQASSQSGWYIMIVMFLAVYITWIVYRSKKYRSLASQPEHKLFRQELVADILLTASVSVMTFVLWEKGILAMLSRKAVTSMSDVWFLFAILSVGFILCYLPLRYLYLIEDHSSRQTWRRLLLIFAFLLLRSFFEIVKIG